MINFEAEKEIEMAQILSSFIITNGHYFSPSVMEIINKLIEEVKKQERKYEH